LPAGEALLVDHDAVALDGDATRQENLQPQSFIELLADILP
jgi:hypothetical protein